ncbi:hypothetical protein [Alteromonas gracilis]|uniref:hypothetical protein n=1 Tax=Alteromonas gracilis TaxID=1479524 RepID=UPI0030D132DE
MRYKHVVFILPLLSLPLGLNAEPLTNNQGSIPYSQNKAAGYSVSKPENFVLGESVEYIKKEALKVCKSIEEREIAPITGPLAKLSQNQIDCEGLYYAGKPRSVELVFQDDQLDLIWILIPELEKEHINNAMTKTYGAPTMVIDYGAIYLQVNAAVRNKPSEVLFASSRQTKVMLKKLKEEN